jgi:hypothetical protein
MTHYYTASQFEQFCLKIFNDFSSAGIDNIQVVCPFCKKIKGKNYQNKKLAIHIRTHMLHCWVCGYRAKNLESLLRKFHPDFLNEYRANFDEILDSDLSDELQDEIVRLPNDFTLLSCEYDNLPFEKRRKIFSAKKYLENRGITSENDLWYWKVGISFEDSKYKNRIIVPSFDDTGELNYFTARAIFDHFSPKYENPKVERENIIFNEININWNKELYLVEGVFDAFKCTDNCVPLLGSELSGDYKLFQKIVENTTPVILALDPDAIHKTLNIAKRLKEFEINVKIIDISNSGYKDIGEMSKQEFINVSKFASMFNTEYFLKQKIASIV